MMVQNVCDRNEDLVFVLQEQVDIAVIVVCGPDSRLKTNGGQRAVKLFIESMSRCLV